MPIDSLLKAIPDSPLVTVLIIVAATVVIADLILRLYAGFMDRRSDQQLLDQADKAASILEKLPANHQTRFDVLEYISSGPISELNRRQAEKSTRQKESKKRKQRSDRAFTAFFAGTFVFFFVSEEAIQQIPAMWEFEELGYTGRVYLIFMAVAFLLLLYLIIVYVIYGFVYLTDKARAYCAKKAQVLRNRIFKRAHKEQDENETNDV